MSQLALSTDNRHLVGWPYSPSSSAILRMNSWRFSQAMRFRVKSRIPRQTSPGTRSADSITCTTPLPPPLLTDSTPALVTLLALCSDTVLALCIRAPHEAVRGTAFLQERAWLVSGQGLGGAS